MTQGQWLRAQQIDEHELSRVRNLDGIIGVSQASQTQGAGRVDPSRVKPGGRCVGHGCADGFNPELELKVDCENLQWSILPKALEVGNQAEEAYRAAKEGGHLPNRAKKERKKGLEDRLSNEGFMVKSRAETSSPYPHETALKEVSIFLFVSFIAPSSD